MLIVECSERIDEKSGLPADNLGRIIFYILEADLVSGGILLDRILENPIFRHREVFENTADQL